MTEKMYVFEVIVSSVENGKTKHEHSSLFSTEEKAHGEVTSNLLHYRPHTVSNRVFPDNIVVKRYVLMWYLDDFFGESVERKKRIKVVKREIL